MSTVVVTPFDLAFPAKVQPGSRVLGIRVSPSIAGSLFGALDYLTTFPYGCVEQTMSSFLPNIVVTQAVNELGLKVSLDTALVQQKIRTGIDRLNNFQHEDGGWGWWETDESHPFMTAYVVAGLAQAKAAGVQVDDARIENGAKWIGKAFAADAKLAFDLRAYMQYALVVAGKPDGNALGQVFEQRTKLGPYGLAILGLALELVKDARAGEILLTSIDLDGTMRGYDVDMTAAVSEAVSIPVIGNGWRSRMPSRRGGRPPATRCWISPRTPRQRPPPTQ